MSGPPDVPARIALDATDVDLPDEMVTGFERFTDFVSIARGAKGELRSCWDPITGRRVAVKTLRDECAHDSTERRRFLREARVTSQLQHPHTVPVYEIGRQPSGALYFTMKCIAGEDLFKVLQRLSWSDRVTEEAYPVERLIEVVIGACQACAYAHAHGVVHRDLKPENLWLGAFGEMKVLDWGVAKVWGAGHSEVDGDDCPMPDDELDQELAPLTRVGQRPGTPLYMSPEQVLGHASLDARSDIFSMGVLIYEMMAFREPFRGRTVRQTFENILHDEPPPVSAVAKRQPLPPSLDRLVMRAIAKDPEDRFASMLEVIDALEAVRHDLAVG